MKRDFKVYLDDILESITRIEEYTKGISAEEFLKTVSIQDAVIRRFEIIGEAVKHIPEEIRQKHPKVEWRKIAGARDIFTHEKALTRVVPGQQVLYPPPTVQPQYPAFKTGGFPELYLSAVEQVAPACVNVFGGENGIIYL